MKKRHYTLVNKGLSTAVQVIAASFLLAFAAADPMLAQSKSTLSRGGFELARPGFTFEFPRDHGNHEQFRTEWWYFTGHLRSEAGRRYGFELTFFRAGVSRQASTQPTAWDLRDVSLAHFAITDVARKELRYYEKLNRTTPYIAAAREGSLAVWNESWRASTEPDGAIRITASDGEDAINLRLQSRKPPAIHGVSGVSVKALGEGYASHYYSLTRLIVTGRVTARGQSEDCSGIAWMDHEFGSAALREHQTGWDWFSIQLDNDIELMLYIIRTRDGSPDVTSSGSIILADGRVIHLSRDDFRVKPLRRWKSKRSGATYPVGWDIALPRFNVTLRLKEVFADQELVTSKSTRVTYWEGAVDVNGRFGSSAVQGAGYVEMTGYDKPFAEP